MADTSRITKDDIFLKARLMSEGVRIPGAKIPPFRELKKSCFEIDLPKKLDLEDVDGVMRLFHQSIQSDSTKLDVMGNRVNMQFNNLRVPLYPNPHSRLECVTDGDDVAIYEGGEQVCTGRMEREPAWYDEKLSNGLPARAAMPAVSAEVINVVFSLSCINMNTNRGCHYCGFFANPVSRKIVMLPKKSLKAWARYQGEAVKIATDNGWRGMLAVTGGALPPAHRREYLERLDILMSGIREVVGDKTLSDLQITYNHYPPENLADMYEWKELGIKGTSIDIEVMDPAYFRAICPGKSAYKPHEYWKEAQQASVDVFGPYLQTSGCVVVGVEPMELLLKGIDERLSKGVLPIPLIYFSTPGSACWGHRAPTAEWLVETTERMADIYVKHSPKIIRSLVKDLRNAGVSNLVRGAVSKVGERGARSKTSDSAQVLLVFDEIQRRIGSELFSSLARLAGDEIKNWTRGLFGGPGGSERG